MVEREDFVFRPVMRGLVRAESIFDGSVSLGQIALLNEAMEVETENQFRQRKAAEAIAKKR